MVTHETRPDPTGAAGAAVASGLTGTTLAAAVRAFGGQGTGFAIRLAGGILLARLIAPAEFGLVALAMAATSFLALFRGAGLVAAVVQRPDLTPAQASALFRANLLASLATAAAAALLAAPLARLLAEPRLLPVTVALAASLLVGGAGAVHEAFLRREMRLGAVAVVQVAALAVSYAIALGLAAGGHGLTALLAQPVAQAAIQSAGFALASGFRPGRAAPWAELRPLLAFGGTVSGAQALNHLARNLDNLLIGWAWGAGPLGLYSRAYGLMVLPLRQVNEPAGAAVIPALARLAGDPAGFRALYLRSLRAVTAVSAPLPAFLLVLAADLIPWALGPAWTDCVPIFRLLAISGLLQPSLSTLGWLYLATGRGRPLLQWGTVSSAVIALSFLAGLPFGPQGVALAYSIAILLLAWPAVRFACQGTPLTPAEVALAAAWPLGAALASAAAGVALLHRLGGPATLAVMLLVHAALLLGERHARRRRAARLPPATAVGIPS